MTEEIEEVEPICDYLVTQTRTILVAALSAADARSTAETIFQIAPNNKMITTTVKTEKVRH